VHLGMSERVSPALEILEVVHGKWKPSVSIKLFMCLSVCMSVRMFPYNSETGVVIVSKFSRQIQGAPGTVVYLSNQPMSAMACSNKLLSYLVENL